MFEQGNGVDLSRLNEAERQVLRLLAEGHTAKSVANELGSTPAAVNERLREARRKTGAGSSRELARLLKSQENRHDEMGVVHRALANQSQGQSVARHWRRQLGALSMLLFVAAGAVALMSQNPQTSNEAEPLIGAPLERFKQPADLHAQVRSELRDPEWAPRMEKAIKARVLKIPLIGKDGNELRVTCAATLCEIAGSIVAPPSTAEREDPQSQFSKTIRDLQVPPLPDDLARFGLKHESGNFTGAKGKPDQTVFLLYYSRTK